MKIRSRLLITFCVMIIVPLLLMEVTLFVLTQNQVRSFEKNYDITITNTGYYSMFNSVSILDKVVQKIYLQLKQDADEKPELFEESGYLESMYEEARKKNIRFLVTKEGSIYYPTQNSTEYTEMGMENLIELIPLCREEEDDTNSGIYIGGENSLYIKTLQIDYKDGSTGCVFLIADLSLLLKQMNLMEKKIMLAMLFILIFTAIVLVVWIYRSILNPLYKLQQATNEIKGGNLDFVLDNVDGEDEFSELFRDFEEMRQNLKESEDAKRKNDAESKELISNISHDLKTPITAVKGYCEGIMDGVADTPEKVERYVRTIYNKAMDMDRLINELTFYSKIDTNRIPYSFARINVKDYFDDCAEELMLDLESKHFQFEYRNELDPNTYMIADVEQLKRVINNIVSNSIKYMDKTQGKISLYVKDSGDFIQVELKDNGKGISAHDLPYIFDRFFRTDQSRNSAMGGSGIGLSIVKKIIEDHHGRIWANSKVGEGTTMNFVIRKYMEAIGNE